MRVVAGAVHGLSLSFILLLAAGTGCAPPTVKSVTLSPEDITVPAGLNHQYTLMGTYSDGTVADLTGQALWVTSDQAVASISSGGLLHSVSPGTATVSANFEHLSVIHQVTVTNATLNSILVTPKSPVLPLGAVGQLAAMGTFSDGTTQDLSSSASWSSSAELVATCNLLGRTTAVSVGSTDITATLSGVSGKTTLSVTPAVVLSLHVTPGLSHLPLGRSQQLVVTASFTDGTLLDVTQMAQWSSTDGTKASITQQGVVKALALGAATLQLSYGNQQAQVPLTVTAAAVDTLQILPAELETPKGLTDQLSAVGTYSDGTISDVTDLVAWSSSEVNVATIDDVALKGLATGVSQGATTITAALDEAFASVILSVGEPEVLEVDISPADPSLPLGQSLQLTATATYSDGSTKDVTHNTVWTSLDQTLTTVSPLGLAVAIAQGATDLTAQVDDVIGVTSLTVTAPVLLSIDVLPQDETLPVGLTDTYYAFGNYSDGRRVDISAQVLWASSDGSASISPSGLVTSLAQGSTQISAQLDGVPGYANLTLTAAVLQSIAVTPAGDSVPVGLTKAFVATGSYSDASLGNITDSVVWSSSVVGTATISNTSGSRGVATGKALGATLIGAAMNGISGAAVLSVTAPVLVSISVTPTNPRVSSGGTVQMTATGVMSDTTTVPLTQLGAWSSNTPAVATVSNAVGSQGSVSVLKKGGPVTLSVLYNGVTGSTQLTGVVGFTRAANAALTIRAESVKLADFNGDGNLDYVASWGWTGQNQLAVGLGNGDGTFGAATYFWPGGLAAADVITGDFNGDGKADIAAANTNSNTLSILAGNGAGGFATPVSYRTGSEPRALAAADLNNDGRLDIVVSNRGQPSTTASISVFLQQATGVLLASQTQNAYGNSGLYGIALADVDGPDGRLDVICATGPNWPVSPHSAMIFKGNGNGTFGGGVFRGSLNESWYPTWPATADFNKDGRADLAMGWSQGKQGVSISIRTPYFTDPDFRVNTLIPVSSPWHVLATDIDGDGNPDVLAPEYGSNTLAVITGRGDGTFNPVLRFVVGNRPFHSAVGDLNGDGLKDVVVANSDSTFLAVLLQQP